MGISNFFFFFLTEGNRQCDSPSNNEADGRIGNSTFSKIDRSSSPNYISTTPTGTVSTTTGQPGSPNFGRRVTSAVTSSASSKKYRSAIKSLNCRHSVCYNSEAPNKSSRYVAASSSSSGGYFHMPTDFRPGRLSPIEILGRIFPTQKKTILELVLQGCNGDLVKAIEHFLSANDAIYLQQAQIHQQQLSQRQLEQLDIQIHQLQGVGVHHNQVYPNSSGLSPPDTRSPSFHLSRNNGCSDSKGIGSVKSAFTPLNGNMSSGMEPPMAHKGSFFNTISSGFGPASLGFGSNLESTALANIRAYGGPGAILPSTAASLFSSVQKITGNAVSGPTYTAFPFGPGSYTFATGAPLLFHQTVSENGGTPTVKAVAACPPGCSQCRPTEISHPMSVTSTENSISPVSGERIVRDTEKGLSEAPTSNMIVDLSDRFITGPQNREKTKEDK